MSWVFNRRGPTTNPEKDLTIRDVSGGCRDDFSHAGIRLSDHQIIFRFALGRPCSRALTPEERAAHPHSDFAFVYQIAGRDLTLDQRQSIQEWLQTQEDGWVAVARSAGKERKHYTMLLRSVDYIEGY
uniref:hypothetical protein n=1 Tax=Edaphosphingomonas laterariae TaxID=861865 RepID=UPI001181C22D|nr:hypothetical protein [Sphingomonas laterariae]